MLVWPANRVGGMMTINGARGLHPRIADRMDLTLECVRRYYLGQSSPLGDVLARYGDFFDLFEHFGGYMDFFLLQGMVTEDHSVVTFFCHSTITKLRRHPRMFGATWCTDGCP